MLEMEFKFSKISSVRSKALYVDVSPNQWHGWPLRPDRHFSKEMEKNICVKEICKIHG